MEYRHLKSLVDIYQGNQTIDHLAYRVNYFVEYDRNAKDEYDRNAKDKGRYNKPSKEYPFPQEAVNLLTAETKGVLRKRREALVDLHPLEEVRIGSMKLIGRIVHGMGEAHIREVSLTIHPVYGIPYIPASSVKGLVRHWVIQSLFQGVDPAKKKEMTEREKELRDLYFDLFGSAVKGEEEKNEDREIDSGIYEDVVGESRKGLATFYDIYFVGGKIVPDVLTSHFKDYYKEKDRKPPHTSQDTNPVTFYTVESVKPVEVIISISKDGGRKRLTTYPVTEMALLLQAWTKNALTEWGIGAKTALNYGRFTEFEDITMELELLRERLPSERKEWMERQRKQMEEQKTLLEEKRLAEERKKREEEERLLEEKRLSEMSDEERLAYNIRKLDPLKSEDRERSKGEIYKEVEQRASKVAAEALRAYWKKSGDWIEKEKPKKKQEEKVAIIKKIIEG